MWAVPEDTACIKNRVDPENYNDKNIISNFSKITIRSISRLPFSRPPIFFSCPFTPNSVTQILSNRVTKSKKREIWVFNLNKHIFLKSNKTSTRSISNLRHHHFKPNLFPMVTHLYPQLSRQIFYFLYIICLVQVFFDARIQHIF